MISNFHKKNEGEPISARISSLCRASDYFQKQVDDLKRKRKELEEKREKLLQKEQEMEAEILKLKLFTEEASSQCQVEMEKSSVLTDKLLQQTKRKKEMNNANLWLRTGSACGSLFQIILLREDLQKLKEKILFPSDLFLNYFKTEKEKKEGEDKIRFADASAVSSLKEAARMMESNLSALAKESSLIEPGRLTFAEKEKVKKILISECDEKVLVLSLLLSAANKMNIQKNIKEEFAPQREKYFKLIKFNLIKNNKMENKTEEEAEAEPQQTNNKRISDATTATGSPSR